MNHSLKAIKDVKALSDYFRPKSEEMQINGTQSFVKEAKYQPPYN